VGGYATALGLCAKYLKKSYENFDRIFCGVEHGPSNNRLNFGGDPDHDSLFTIAIL